MTRAARKLVVTKLVPKLNFTRGGHLKKPPF